MLLKQQQLTTHLNGKLAPAYLIHGDEPLLLQEAHDEILQCARKQGFDHRDSLLVGPGFDWAELALQGASRSLFHSKTILDVNNPEGKFDESTSDALSQYFSRPLPDKLLIICSDRIPSTSFKRKWYTLLLEHGVVIPLWTIDKTKLPQWIQQRAQKLGVKLQADAVSLLADLTEGNLLATQQTLIKLQLSPPSTQPISSEWIARIINDSASYTVFDLANATLAGQPQQALNILQHLLQADIEPILCLWALQRELQTILQKKQQDGAPAANAAYNPQAALHQKAQQRLSLAALFAGIKLAAEADLVVKGQRAGNITILLDRLIWLMSTGKNWQI